MLSNEYIAGFFDGEGCIVLTANGQAKVLVSQKNPEILYLIQMQYGGRVIKNGDCFNLQISKKELMLAFLEAIRSYCVVKRDKVEIAIPFIKLTQSNEKRNQGKDGRFLSSKTSSERDLLRSRFYSNNCLTMGKLE